MDRYDLAVVGAGPAGSMAALTAQQKGLRTLLIERQDVVGSNVICGEGVGSSLFVDLLELRPSWVSSRVDRVVFSLGDLRAFSIDVPAFGWVLNREAFDFDLSKMASDGGVTLLTGAVAEGPLKEGERMVGLTVESKGRKRDYYARAFIGADGMASMVGRWAGLDTVLRPDEVVSCAQCLVESDEIVDHTAEFIFGSRVAPGGYGWIFSKGKGRANVGIGVTPGCGNAGAGEFLDAFLGHRFKDWSVLARKCGGVSGRFKGEIARENVLLCGDAARVGDPLSGGGIYNAVLSGTIAGELVAETEPALLEERYRKMIWGKMGRDIRFKEALRRIYLRIQDEEIEELWSFLRGKFGGRTLTGFSPVGLIAAFVCRHPLYLRYIPGLLKSVF